MSSRWYWWNWIEWFSVADATWIGMVTLTELRESRAVRA
jgi:hypothetical protein